MTTTARRALSAAPAPVRLGAGSTGFGSSSPSPSVILGFAVLIVPGLTGGLLFVVSSAISQVFPSPEARDEIVRLGDRHEGIAQGVAGEPVNIGSLGGYVQWKYGPVRDDRRACGRSSSLSSTLAGGGTTGQPRA